MTTAVTESEVPIPKGVKVELGPDGTVTVQGPNGKLRRRFRYSGVDLRAESDRVVVHTGLAHRQVAAVVGTFAGHLGNMIHGAQHDYTAVCRAVNAHFPIKLRTQNDEILVENFLGEKAPRRSKIVPGVKVQIKAAEITLTGPDIEAVGQTAANLEHATKVRKRDRRVFLDGVYIVEKPR